MKNLSNYIQNLDFEYAISYSGLRGERFMKLNIENQEKIQQIEKKIESARYMPALKLRKKMKALSDEVDLTHSRVINQTGNLHKSAIEVHRFEKEDKEIKSILKVLKSKFREQCVTMCRPTFRDAIVFFSEKGNILGILQICFGCISIEDENQELFEVDHKIFPKLKKELIRLGHQIKDE